MFVNVIHVSDFVGHLQELDNVEMNLIDNVFLEFADVVALLFEQVSFVRTIVQEGVGDSGRVTIVAGLNAICAQGFNGSDCSTFCQEIDESLTCEKGIKIHPSHSFTLTLALTFTLSLSLPFLSLPHSLYL